MMHNSNLARWSIKKLATNDIHVFCLTAIYSTLYYLRRHE